MFFRKQLSTTPLKPSDRGLAVVQPLPISVEAELRQEERIDYARVCREIGFHPAALIKQEIIGFLEDRQLRIFPYEQVKVYLDDQFGIKKKDECVHRWGWCPLREVDKLKSNLVLHARSFDTDNGEVEFNRTYHGAIPIHVLDLVKEISTAVPGLAFFVSDVVKPRDRSGDPFLAVTTPGLEEMLVIAEWDEPSFGMIRRV